MLVVRGPGVGLTFRSWKFRTLRQEGGSCANGEKCLLPTGCFGPVGFFGRACAGGGFLGKETRSEEHTSELQSLVGISYAVFCLKKKNTRLNSSHLSVSRMPSSA